nr:hypothetical protein [Tanacetum cinerariifolium]
MGKNSTAHARNVIDKTERECKLYDEFDKFAYKKGESLREFYLRFSLLLNDMNIYNMKLEQFQVNTKFLNTLPLEWSKLVTDVKLVRDLHTTNVDQLHAYLGKHKFHANEFCLMHERNSDPLDLVSFKYGSPYQSLQYGSHAHSSTPLSITYPSHDFQSSVHHNVYNPSSSIPQVEYAPTVHQQSDFSQPDTGLIVLVFQKGDDPIDAINRMMAFLTVVVTSRVTVQPIQGRQNSLAAGALRPYTSGPSGNNLGKQRTVVCYNCKGEGHMLKQCTKPKWKRDEAWFKDKLLFVQAQANEQIPHEEETVQNSNLPAQHNALILSVIEQIKTQVVNCTKINQDNKSVNEILTAELERYKDQYVYETQQAAVQNSNSYAQQDVLILSVIEQLKTQVINCTKINLDNKSVNDTLTIELERYKEQVKVLKEGQNVDLKSQDNVLDSCEQSVEINRLKQTLSEQIKKGIFNVNSLSSQK